MTIEVTRTHSVMYPDQEADQLSALNVFNLRPVMRFNQIDALKYNPQFEGLTKEMTHADSFHSVQARYCDFRGVAGIELTFTGGGAAQTLKPIIVPLYLSYRESIALHNYFLIHCLNEGLNEQCNGEPLPVYPPSNKSYRMVSILIDSIATQIQAESETELEYFTCTNTMVQGEFEDLPDYTCLLHKSFEFGNHTGNSFKVIVKDRKLSVLLHTLNEMKTSEFLSTDDPIDAWSFPLPDFLPNFTAEKVLDLIKPTICYTYLTYDWKGDFGDAKIEDFAQAIADKLNLYYNFFNTMKHLYGKQ